ncbi:MAG: polyprenyl synthetase family protein [Gemmatimonadetes bacterium]|nr:polyprenyl synthetase family protein [Gemmatimonadota bacterium]NNM06190.1 polyprenyl synthetase family protein [Gemmatimonadota bacterium]
MTSGLSESDLKGFLGYEREKVEDALAQALAALGPRVPVEFRGALEHGVTSGGKRLRPILCVAAYRAAGGGHPGIYRLAVSLEMIHAYSLMHDDLPCMDDADLRRGEPTTHKVHGQRSTTVAGALLIPGATLHAYEAARAMGLPEATRRELVVELSRASGGGGMVGGQVLDLLGEGEDLQAPDLDDLHRRKTGALLRASLRMGGIAAGVPPEGLEGLDRYGAAIGLAFQIADDVLDATASAKELGKNPSDADLGKSTYVSLFGVQEAGRKAGELVSAGVTALREGGLESRELEALAHYIVERKR